MLVNICVPCVCSTYRGWKKESDPLRLELQVLVSCPMGAGKGIQPWSPRRAASVLTCRDISLAPSLMTYYVLMR